jgi:hypothetical protein
MLKTTQLNNGDISDHDAIQHQAIWGSELVPEDITLENVALIEDVIDEMSLRFERTFS